MVLLGGSDVFSCTSGNLGEFRVLLGGFHFFRVLLGYQQKIMYLWVVYPNYFFQNRVLLVLSQNRVLMVGLPHL